MTHDPPGAKMKKKKEDEPLEQKDAGEKKPVLREEGRFSLASSLAGSVERKPLTPAERQFNTFFAILNNLGRQLQESAASKSTTKVRTALRTSEFDHSVRLFIRGALQSEQLDTVSGLLGKELGLAIVEHLLQLPVTPNRARDAFMPLLKLLASLPMTWLTQVRRLRNMVIANEVLMSDLIRLLEQRALTPEAEQHHTLVAFLVEAMRTNAQFAAQPIASDWWARLSEFVVIDSAKTLQTQTQQLLKRMGAIVLSLSQPPHVPEEEEEAPARRRNREQHQSFQEGPGRFRVDGPRHDNDSEAYRDISVLPTLEEIVSEEDPYLPKRLEMSNYGFNAVDKVLDRLYRLFRHDSLQPVMAAVRHFHLNATLLLNDDKWQTTLNGAGTYIRVPGGEATIILQRNVRFEGLHISLQSGATLNFSFAQPKQGTPPERTKFWKEEGGRKLFAPGSIVIVRLAPKRVADDGTEKEEGDGMANFLLATVNTRLGSISGDRLTVGLRPLDGAQLEQCLEFYSSVDRQKRAGEDVLFTIHNHFFTATLPVLKALQSHAITSLPLQTSIIPEMAETCAPPEYLAATNGDFYMDLSLLQRPNASTEAKEVLKRVRIASTVSLKAALDKVADDIVLDRTQIAAFAAALTQQVSVIQGPPGCGKTYIGVKVALALIANLAANDKMPKGPILCITYTNHALDQYLRALIDDPAGISRSRVLRLGSGSKDPVLQECGLRQRLFDARSYREIGARKGAQAEATRIQDQMRQDLAWLAKTVDELTLEDLDHCVLSITERDRQYIEKGRAYAHFRTAKRVAAGDFDVDEDECSDTDDEFDGEEDEFVTVGPKGKAIKDPLQRWLLAHDLTADEEAKDPAADHPSLKHVWSLSKAERRAMAEKCLAEVQEVARFGVVDEVEKFERTQQADYEAADLQVSRRVAAQMQVIGMTTSGAALNQSLLQALEPAIVICEEAGEVSEPHMLASLSSGCQQLILIVDHQQLRSKASYAMTVESGSGYDLDMSLFERLALQREGTEDLITLHNQRRMHPSISALIRPLYPALENDALVNHYPPVRGMSDRLWFFDTGNHLERAGQPGSDELTSKVNEWEAQMVVALVQYLVQQGYKPSEIAVLSSYAGQLRQISDGLSKVNVAVGITEQTLINEGEMDEVDLEWANDQQTDALRRAYLRQCVRLATVDGFQGEEAEVVVVSTVRNNKACRVGFLKTDNRVNVMLSRAKHGMYIFGSAPTHLTENNTTLFAKAIQTMQAADQYGDGFFRLRCDRHPKHAIEIRGPGDFKAKCPDGGCDLPCEERLPCGHRCPLQCHAEGPNGRHQNFDCNHPCPKKCPDCQMPCTGLCGKRCGPCEHLMDFVLPFCGHLQSVPCGSRHTLSLVECKALVPPPEEIQCAHLKAQGGIPCGDATRVRDQLTAIAGQKARGETPRFERKLLQVCKAKCGLSRSHCQHLCQSACGACAVERLVQEDDNVHAGNCKEPCDRALFCTHRCQGECHGALDCPPCERKCGTQCEHSKCSGRCRDPCAICIEPCSWRCRHQAESTSCDLPCGIPCQRLPCDVPCDQHLSCGHPCPSICGETCPDPRQACLVCAEPKYMEQVVDFTMMTSLALHDATEGPLMTFACGHSLLMSGADQMFGMAETYYVWDNAKEQWSGLKPLERDVVDLPRCPICRETLTGPHRYKRIINWVALAKSGFKFIKGHEAACAKVMSKCHSWLKDGKALIDCHNMTDKEKEEQEKNLHTLRSRLTRLKNRLAALREAKDPLEKAKELVAHAEAVPPTLRSAAWRLFTCRARVQVAQCVFLLAMIEFEQALFASVGRNNQVSFGKKESTIAETPRLMLACAKEYLDAWAEGDALAEAAHSRLSRLELLAEMLMAQAQSLHLTQNRLFSHVSESHTEIDELLRRRFATHIGKAVQLLKELKADAPSQRLRTLDINIERLVTTATEKEYDQIFTAMAPDVGSGVGSFGGHWYACRNGHPYAIGECGGAMEESTCPECGETIGGEQHQLAAGNTVFAPMASRQN